MADADEDAIPRSGPQAEDTDLSDETQDFRFLAIISNEDAKIPKRGEKDFEPHATALQSNTLAASRQAMHNALAVQRVHQPRGYTRATYHPESNMAYSCNPKGPLFAKMGQVLPAHEDPLGKNEGRGQRLWLLPEEVTYLIERGTVDVRWPSGEDDEGAEGPAMSLQGAYAMFIGDEDAHSAGLTFERYSVYSGLKRMGYIVHRAPSWKHAGQSPGIECYAPIAKRTWQIGFFNVKRMWSLLKFRAVPDVSEEQAEGPLVAFGLYRSYAEIYRRLTLIKYHDPTAIYFPQDGNSSPSDPTFRVTYHVWKPGSQTYKKSAPGPPDFRIAVVNARETAMPMLNQLSALLEMVPYDPPREDGQLYQKLKHGYKNVILAIVDQGVVSYLRFVDAAFGREKLFDREVRGSYGKRGGGKGGRGRGR